MPEGDTGYLEAKRMAAALSGQHLIRGELRHPRPAEHDLSGRAVLGVHSVGKHLFTRFDDQRSLHTHRLRDQPCAELGLALLDQRIMAGV